MKQIINCEYSKGNWTLQPGAYDCRILNQDIIYSNDADYVFRGIHITGMTNLDVMAINFLDCKISKIPQGLTKIFPKAEFLQFWNCGLKAVEREDLKEYSEFTDLTIVYNDIAFLPGDLLADMKNLVGVWLHDNKTQLIEPNIFFGLNNIKVIDLKNNQCIDKIFDALHGSGNGILNEIKNEISRVYERSPWRFLLERNKQLEVQVNKLIENQSNEVSSAIAKIIKNDDFKDFTITVDKEKFQVHKLVLAARCQVFAEMIQNNIHVECLNLVDISSSIFQEILNFIYTDELPTSSNIDYAQLFAAAGRLKIEKLKNFAAEKLTEIINPENALDILNLSNKFENEQLQQKSFEVVKDLLSDMKISDDLATNTEKLKKALDVKKKKEEFMKAMDDEMNQILKM